VTRIPAHTIERSNFRGPGTAWWGLVVTASSMTAALIVAAALAAVIFLRHGTGEQSTIRALQITARWSFLLFWPAYSGGAIARLFGPYLDGLAHYGRDFGLAFGSAQLVHVGLILWLNYIAPGPNGGMVFFWVGILCVYLLALFSLPSLRASLGKRSWQTFRTATLEYIALAFAADFILLPLNGLGNDTTAALSSYPLINSLFASMLVSGFGLRLASSARRRNEGRREYFKPSKTISLGVGALLFASIGIGLLDLFDSLNALAASVALLFVISGVFNTWRSLTSPKS
jgi:hypothetical protein